MEREGRPSMPSRVGSSRALPAGAIRSSRGRAPRCAQKRHIADAPDRSDGAMSDGGCSGRCADGARPTSGMPNARGASARMQRHSPAAADRRSTTASRCVEAEHADAGDADRPGELGEVDPAHRRHSRVPQPLEVDGPQADRCGDRSKHQARVVEPVVADGGQANGNGDEHRGGVTESKHEAQPATVHFAAGDVPTCRFPGIR
jgi:hypothetical protein